MIRLLLSLPLLLVVVLFALSNTQDVRLSIWPTDLSASIPVSVVVLGSAALAFVLGALLLWFSALAARRRARRAEHAVRLLEAQVAELKAELMPLRTRAGAPRAHPAGGQGGERTGRHVSLALPWRG